MTDGCEAIELPEWMRSRSKWRWLTPPAEAVVHGTEYWRRHGSPDLRAMDREAYDHERGRRVVVLAFVARRER